MKTRSFWIVLLVGLSFAAMVGVHGWASRETQAQLLEMDTLVQRDHEASGLMIDLEKYRRENANFRKMAPSEVTAVKERLKSDSTRGIAAMQKLGASTEEQALGAQVLNGIAELMIVSAKIESHSYTAGTLLKDVYQKTEVREIHDAILLNLDKIRQRNAGRAARIEAEGQSQHQKSLRIIAVLAIQGFGWILLILLGQYFSTVRPLQKLRKRMEAFKTGDTPATPSKLRGVFQQLDSTLAELYALVELQRRERYQFLVAVSIDLRPPLLMLQTGISRFISGAADAADMLKHSAIRVSKTLDSLTDLVDIDRKALRLNEEVIDLNDLLVRTAAALGGGRSSYPIHATTPDVPIWILLDPRRFESVLISLISKIIQHFPQGCGINITLQRLNYGEERGLEILVQESSQASPSKHATGPKLDVLQHWVSENGFGMALAQKIIKAHGGALRVAGLSGVGIEFSVLLPHERIATAAGPFMGLSRSFESQRVESMLPQQGVNFRS